MRQINLYEAKTNLSRLADEAPGGEEIVIARAGKPLVRLVPCRAEDAPRRPGQAQIWVGEGFDAPPDGEPRAPLPGGRPRYARGGTPIVQLLPDTHASLYCTQDKPRLPPRWRPPRP